MGFPGIITPMPSTNSTGGSVGRIVLVAVILAVIIVPAIKLLRPAPVAQAPVTQPVVTLPASLPATRPVIKDFMRLVSLNYPDFPATRPLDSSIDLSESAHILLKYPLAVDAFGDLWIHHEDGADPLAVVLKPAQVNIVNRKVLFSHRWRYSNSSRWKYGLVVPSKTRQGFDFVDEDQTRLIAKKEGYDWTRALSLQDGRIAVPTANGVSIFTIPVRGGISESESPSLLSDPDQPHAPVQIIEFNDSIIFWIPPTDAHPGSSGAIRWIAGGWKRLQGDDWPDHLVALIPLYDSIIQFIGSEQSAKFVTVSMERAAVSQEELTKKILQLGDPDPDIRDAAERQLSRYRNTLWPLADKLMDTVHPEIQIRLQNLLRARDFPMLGNCEPKDGKVRIVSRFQGGGMLFYNAQGALLPNGNQEPTLVSPAWILAAPGFTIHVLQGEFLTDLDPDIHRLVFTPSGAWISQDAKNGLRMHIAGERWMKLTRKGEEAFTTLENVDAAGRLILRTSLGAAGPALLIDPRLPDIRPRLPIWTSEYQAVGWDKNDLPAATLQGNGMVFQNDHWTVIDKKTNAFNSDPATIPALAPTSTWPAELGKPLAKDPKGNLFFDGTNKIVMITPSGDRLDLPLPPDAVGTLASPALAAFGADRLFLYNKPGQISRLRLIHNKLELDANFTQGAPETEKLTRMWIDSGKRLVMIWDKKLALAFPDGYIPKSTRTLIPANAMPNEED